MQIQNLYILSELSLFLGILHLACLRLLSFDMSKSYMRVARFWSIISLLFAIIFYDKTLNPNYFENNAYTLLMKLLMYCFTFILYGMSNSWFVSFKKTGYIFYSLLLLALIIMNLLISSNNLLITTLALLTLLIINYLFSYIFSKKTKDSILVKHLPSWFIMAIFFAADFILYQNLQIAQDWNTIKKYLITLDKNILGIFIVTGVVVPFLYMLDIAPFCFIKEKNKTNNILPINHFFAIVEPLALWGAFFTINIKLLSIYQQELSMAYFICAMLSIILGAIGTNAEINLNKICFYTSLYFNGLVLLLLSFFTAETDFMAFLCLFLFILSLNGFYTVFYSLRSHGEYLTTTISLAGISETKPYLTTVILLSLFSFMGLPPLSGFLSQLNIINELAKDKLFIVLGIILVSILFLARAYLEIIKELYAEEKPKLIDTVSKKNFIYTLICAILIVVVTFNPLNLFEILKDMFYVIYM